MAIKELIVIGASAVGAAGLVIGGSCVYGKIKNRKSVKVKASDVVEETVEAQNSKIEEPEKK